MPESPPSSSRRDVIKALTVAGIAGATGGSLPIAASAQLAPTTQPNTMPSTSPSTPDAITVADVAAADKLAARDASPEERQLMLGSLETYRKRYKRFRELDVDVRIEPAVHFDPRLPGTQIPGGPSACVLSDGPAIEPGGDVEALAFAGVADLARLIRARRVSSTQLTRMYLDRLKRFGPRLVCVVNLCEELALKQAARADAELAVGTYRGPLHGIPYGVKDLLATKGIPTTWGVSPFKDRVFDYDATVIQRLDSACAVLLAKLSLGELAMGDVWFGGKTRNPWKPADGSSGSSAGPGAATAAGLVGFSIGSETLGSIVSPCVENAVTGLRPTWGRVSRYGAMPLTWTLDKLGPMCRSVEDCALVLHAIHGADSFDPTAADVPFAWDPARDLRSLKVGFDPAAFDEKSDAWKDESIKAVYREALRVIRSLAGELQPIALPSADKYSGVIGTIIACESASSFQDLVSSGRIRELVQQEAGSWPNTFRVGATVPAADYLRAMRLRALLMQEMAQALKGIDAYVTRPYAGPTLAFTNLTGHPSLVTRCGLRGDGRPVMVEFIGQLYREDAILQLGHAYERATNWTTYRPNLGALPESPP